MTVLNGHPLNSFIMVGTKMPPLLTFQSKMTLKKTPNVTSIVMLFHGFRSVAKRDFCRAGFVLAIKKMV